MTRWMVLAWSMTAFAVTGCGSEAREATWSPEAAQYAIYAIKIPLYPGTKIKDAMGSERYASTDLSSPAMYGMTWWCAVKATRAEIQQWYQAKLPEARRETDDTGALVLTIVPEGASPRENMGVLIEADGKYRVFEHTLRKKGD
jgi:hypothetical protein